MNKIILIPFVLAITSCEEFVDVGGGAVGVVQEGYLLDYDYIEIGDAFNNWALCDSVSWDEFETALGDTVVEYNCTQFEQTHDLRLGLLTQIENFTVDEWEGLRSGVCQSAISECDLTVENLIQNLENPISVTVQFTIESDSFEISYIGFSNDRREINEEVQLEFLDVIYDNKIWNQPYFNRILIALST